ncbi:MAG: hypothetical protein HQK60_09895 [Deltaproteobacteria bacterium]|nr:hypothetical protein [Deltaproteobacteria bacterium]
MDRTQKDAPVKIALSCEARQVNLTIIKSNIAEARQELERIEALIRTGDISDEGELWVMMQHAYHHINFAWNARNISTERYAHLTHQDFNQFGKFPTDVDELEISDPENG